jgi:hypothetical protein
MTVSRMFVGKVGRARPLPGREELSVSRIRSRGAFSSVVLVVGVAALGACSGDDASDSSSSEESTTTIDDSWYEAAGAFCDMYLEGLPAVRDAEYANLTDMVASRRELRDAARPLEAIDLPDELRTAPTDVPAVWAQADDHLLQAEKAAAAEVVLVPNDEVDRFEAHVVHSMALLTLGGAPCGDPARAENSALNVPVPGVYQVETGFDSVWVSPRSGTEVHRFDPDSGEELAVIEVGAAPFKLQPADGRIIVRTRFEYVAIDGDTNEVVARLPKADVGPLTDRGWAVDGALWICDGARLHRYDPSTFEPTGTVIDLSHPCGQVYATEDLAVAWSYNQDPGESGESVATFVDPATDEVLATVDLPVDATVPIVLDETVFFPAYGGSQNVVVDRATWSVIATPDVGREVAGSQGAFDGNTIYVIADGTDILAIDPQTYEVTDVIEPFHYFGPITSITSGPGALWVATDTAGVLERFDL